MEVVYTCPLGSECETAKDNKIYRCRWYVKIRGKDPQSDEEVDEFRCSMEWMPLLQIEHSLFERQTGAAVESLRNTVTSSMNEQQERMERIISNTGAVPGAIEHKEQD